MFVFSRGLRFLIKVYCACLRLLGYLGRDSDRKARAATRLRESYAEAVFAAEEAMQIYQDPRAKQKPPAIPATFTKQYMQVAPMARCLQQAS